MNVNVLDREGSLVTSPVYYAYKVIKLFEKDKKTEQSIFRVLTILKKDSPEADSKQLFYGLIFLYINGIIDMNGGIVRIKSESATS